MTASPRIGLLCLFGLALIAPNLNAACGGSSPDWFAASSSRNDVRDCVNAASSGDTVNVPPGNSSWNSPIAIDKHLSVIGAGGNSTRVSRSGECFVIDPGYNIRISGFAFQNCTVMVTGWPAVGTAFRIDHNTFTSNSWQEMTIRSEAATPMRHTTGLIDNNTFTNYRVLVIGTHFQLSEGDYQHQIWAQMPPRGADGAPNDIVYIEDNTFIGSPGIHQNWTDANYGGRRVLRFNEIVGQTYAETHSVQGDNRAAQWTEYYKNNITNPLAYFTSFYVRGGGGHVWGNTVDVSPSDSSGIFVNNVRSCIREGSGVGKCDGSSNWDQNGSGQQGYACRDQVGRIRDLVQWSPGSAYTQELHPSYFWGNFERAGRQHKVRINAGQGCNGPDLTSAHLQENRDWYEEKLDFDGSEGVGVGTWAERPSSCTAGVGYWATDRGDWNSKAPGPDGQLYHCTDSGDWALHYVPYTYPHPAQSGSTGGGGNPPAPPTNLTTLVQ